MSGRPGPTGVLRPLMAADLARVRGWRNDPEVRRYMYTQWEISTEEHAAWFASLQGEPARQALIFEREGQPLGFVQMFPCRPGGIADWGFYLAPDAPRGTGMALGAAALRHAFAEVALHKLCGEVLAFNARSLAYHERLGFLREGCLRQQFHDGCTYHDVIRFGLLNSEWQARQDDPA